MRVVVKQPLTCGQCCAYSNWSRRVWKYSKAFKTFLC